MKKYLIFLISILSFSSCQTIMYKGSIYTPVSKQNLKLNPSYDKIEELDKISYININKLSTPEGRDSILKKNQIIVDKVNKINVERKIYGKDSLENKLVTLQEIGYGKLVKNYYKRDLRKNYVGYTAKKLSTLQIILYALGIYVVVGIIAAIITSFLAFIFIYLLFTI